MSGIIDEVEVENKSDNCEKKINNSFASEIRSRILKQRDLF
jgi:hypothetical protein